MSNRSTENDDVANLIFGDIFSGLGDQEPEPEKEYSLTNLQTEDDKYLMGLPSLSESLDSIAIAKNVTDYQEAKQEEVKVPQKTSEKLEVKEESPRKRAKRRKGGGSEEGLPEEFIDKEKMKIKPFGRRTRESIDSRKNLKRSVVIFKWIIVISVVSLAFIGAYKTFFNAEKIGKKEIESISLKALGETGFPIEKGKGFALDFMREYIEAGSGVKNNLGFYYNGSIGESLPDGLTFGKGFKKKIVGNPVIYEHRTVLPYSANYVVGVTVEVSKDDKEDVKDKKTKKEEKPKSETRVEFYDVGVYYDKEKDLMFITPESPTVVPSINVGSKGQIPAQKALGDGRSDTEIQSQVSPTVIGFLEAYSQSSPTNYDKILPFVPKEAPTSLLTGLDGAYTLGDEPSKSVGIEAFKDESGKIKVRAEVRWKVKSSDPEVLGDLRAEMESVYVITLSNYEEKFLVEKIAPVVFVKK